MGSLGWPEILLIVLVIILLFGAKKIPEIARSLRLGMHEFRRSTREITQELDTIDREVDQQPPPTPPKADQ